MKRPDAAAQPGSRIVAKKSEAHRTVNVQIELLLQIAIATLTSLGTLLLGMGEREATLPITAMIVSASSVYLTDVSGWLRLNSKVANIAGSTAVVIFVWDFLHRFGSETQLLAVANLLIYLQFVLLYQAKTVSTYWLLALLSVLQVAVAAALNFELLFGVLLLVYFFCGLVTLGLFFVYRETLRYRPPADNVPADRLAEDGVAAVSGRWPLPCDGDTIRTRWQESSVCPALLSTPFLRQMCAMGIATLAFAVAFFFVVPRVEQDTWRRPMAVGSQSTIGMSEQIKLGELGQIVASLEGVMRVRFFDADSDRPCKLAEAPLFRGFYLTSYSKNSWRRASLDPQAMEAGAQRSGLVRQEVEIEPLETPTLFAVFPVVNPGDQKHPPLYDAARDCLLRSEDQRRNRMTYTLLTSAFRHGRQFPIVPSSSPVRVPRGDDDHPESSLFLQSPRPRLGRLEALARDLVADAGSADTQARARAITNHLHDSGKYKYSLDAPRRNPQVDAIEDFLFEHPQGHCEYFATALTLMLRSVGIPARMVIGFAGGEWNPFGYYQVRQLHAHAWVEAYLSYDELPEPLRREGDVWRNGGWLTLDPTPGVGGLAARMGTSTDWPSPRQIVDFARFLWSSYIMAMDSDRQLRTVYLPLLRGAATFVHGLFDPVRWQRAALLVADSLGLGAAPGAAVAIVALIVCALLVALATWRWQLWSRLARWRTRVARSRTARGHGNRPRIEFYQRLETLLARHGLRRADSLTPLEFARQAAARLAGLSETAAVATVPLAVVESFYRARFGARHLDKQELEAVEQALARLKAALAAAPRT